MSDIGRPDEPRTNILVIPIPDASPRPVVRPVPSGPRPEAASARPSEAPASGPAAPAPDVRESRPAPVVRPVRDIQTPSGPSSGPADVGPVIVWHEIRRTPAAAPTRTRPAGPAPVRTVLIVVGSSAAAVGAAGYVAGLVSSALPFQILGFGAIVAGFLVVIVRTARFVAGHITDGGGQ